ncbi:MAG: D-glycero-beta-D-manno-heptose-7-phosphate kinase [Oligoflexia bacterium]|nr:D-glycero-beta-D-manno-heptose-7-phosphate kinase [Oligoflexia bacterium]
MNVNQNKLFSTMQNLNGKRLLVVGDVGLDEYFIGPVRRISPEAPVPVVEVETQDKRLGLAGNVAANISSLGGVPYLLGVVGDDSTAEVLKAELRTHGCSPEYLVTDSSRPTTRKLRILAGQHHVVRADFERKKFLGSPIEDRILERARELISNCDGVVLQDYAKGVLSERLIEEVIRIAHSKGKFVNLDPNRSTPATSYKGVDYLTPNIEEAQALSGIHLDDLRATQDSIEKMAGRILLATDAQAVVITRGRDGMSLFRKGNVQAGAHIPTFARTVFDVTGAGDTVIAAMSLALAAGVTLEEACVLANFAAGVVVGKVGCVSASPEELKQYILSHSSPV